ncbi:translation release factor [Schizosaccharomyces japonicus yFS275]|uniref:Translation release factor n=1 Tax=Schizosaccharomyces japonicus (strain yFS275 / FY16936) TaxID=402676 RepID=B6K038_SCHJY|nr:translation release factor [Schizosaccharomyces japonicus yFS275]EEB06188.1 translation release factor [Schizosaccharomyces japonicus yFS275]
MQVFRTIWKTGRILHNFTVRLPTCIKFTTAASRGPGGQNVNRVNSKVTMSIPLNDLRQQLPEKIFNYLTTNSLFRPFIKQSVIQIVSKTSRSQFVNKKLCLERLALLVSQAAQHVTPSDPSPGQVKRVEKLKRMHNKQRLLDKSKHSLKKQARRETI